MALSGVSAGDLAAKQNNLLGKIRQCSAGMALDDPSKFLKGFDHFFGGRVYISLRKLQFINMAIPITAHDSHWTALSFDIWPATLPSAKDIQFIL